MSKYKSGLDYFSFDIDFFNDEKIEFVSARFGIVGEIITIKLLCKIYKNGYYLEWDEDKCLLFSKKAGDNISTETVNNVISELVKRGFFNKKLFDKYKILTSHGIQKRYSEAVRRRKNVVIYKEYLLLNNRNADIMPDNVNIIPLNVDILEQSKEKNSKEEKSKEENNIAKDAKASSAEISFDFIGVNKEDILMWKKAYPACDILLCLRQMREWLLSNPSKRKKNYRRFITNWLTRTQEKGGSIGTNKKDTPRKYKTI